MIPPRPPIPPKWRQLPEDFIGMLKHMINSTERLITVKACYLKPHEVEFHKGANKAYKHCLRLHEKYPNAYEKACKEFLKGCACAETEKPDTCADCTDAFIQAIVRIGKES